MNCRSSSSSWPWRWELTDTWRCPGPVRTWLGGLTLTSLSWSLLLGAIGTASAVIAQRNSPYYSWTDNFLPTGGPVEWIDTNGEP